MFRRYLPPLPSLFLLIVLAIFSLPAAQAATYTITDLGALNGNENYSYAYGINASGQVVGGRPSAAATSMPSCTPTAL